NAGHGVEINVRRADDDVASGVRREHGEEDAHEFFRLARRFVHLPVSGDEFASHEVQKRCWLFAVGSSLLALRQTQCGSAVRYSLLPLRQTKKQPWKHRTAKSERRR